MAIPYVQNNWRVKHLANQSKIVVGITLIWRKAVVVIIKLLTFKIDTKILIK